MNDFKVTLNDIQKAKSLLSKYLSPTPLIYNHWLSQEYQAEIFLKFESMQPIGSFKIRGATHRVLALTPNDRKKGVIAASAGNHAQGVAWGCKQLGVSAKIVMPVGASLTKIQNSKALGAEVVLHGATYDEAFEFASSESKTSGRVFVHAYEDPWVIAGQGTCGLEINEELPDANYVFISIGGGGLASGIGISLKESGSEAKLIGCQASGASSMVDSLKKHKIVIHESVNTFADGIAVKRPSPRMHQILEKVVDQAVSVADVEIATAILILLEKAKVIAEGAGAVPLAALEHFRNDVQGKKVVLVISGGNIDVNLLSRIIDLGLVRSGRRLRLNALINDRPGSLSHLTKAIAEAGANVLQVIHDRNAPNQGIDETGVELTLETAGKDHSNQVIEKLKSEVIRFV